MSERMKIAVSCGDLNGIGLETFIKTFTDKRMFGYCTPVLYANKAVVLAHQKSVKGANLSINEINDVSQAKDGVVNVVNCIPNDVQINFGQPEGNLSAHTVNSLKQATADVMAGKAAALVTLPINKDVINQADFSHKGHTEYLRDVAGVDESLMFLVSESMRVGLITNHSPIKEVAGQISQAIILKKVMLMYRSLQQDFGINKPKIAVLGLNPHAGDNGLIGSEELSIIVPALEKLMADGIVAVGPYSADGFFGMGWYSKYDGVMAMYHDQGLLPFKMISFDQGVNFTAGLPFVRTSPDHGTAYDIAGKDIANPESVRNAIFMATEIVAKRKELVE